MPNDFRKQDSNEKTNESSSPKRHPWFKKLSRTIWLLIFTAVGVTFGTIGGFLLDIHPQPILVALTCIWIAAVFESLALRLVLIDHRFKHPMPRWLPNTCSIGLIILCFLGCLYAYLVKAKAPQPHFKW